MSDSKSPPNRLATTTFAKNLKVGYKIKDTKTNNWLVIREVKQTANKTLVQIDLKDEISGVISQKEIDFRHGDEIVFVDKDIDNLPKIIKNK